MGWMISTEFNTVILCVQTKNLLDILTSEHKDNECQESKLQLALVLLLDYSDNKACCVSVNSATDGWLPITIDAKEELCTAVNAACSQWNESAALGSLAVCSVEECVHKLADRLTVTGRLLDVWVDLPSDVFAIGLRGLPLSLYGCLKRLALWHNARIKFHTEDSNSDAIDIVNQFSSWLGGSVIQNMKTDFVSNNAIVWRGRAQIIDRESNKSLCVGDLQLDRPVCNVTGDATLNECCSYLINHRGLNLQETCLSESMEVLDTVDIDSVPDHVITPWRLHLSTHTHNTRTVALLQHIQNMPQRGLIMRLGYGARKLVQDSSLSSKHWKEAVLTGITAMTEADSQMQDPDGFLHFLVTAGGGDYRGTNGTLTCQAYILYPASSFSGRAVTSVLKHAQRKCDMTKNCALDVDDMLTGLPSYSSSAIEELIAIQHDLIQKWMAGKNTANKSSQISLNELKSLLKEVQETALREWSLPENTGGDMEIMETEGNGEKSETRSVIKEWDYYPEHCMEVLALRLEDINNRVISHFQSTDSLQAMSSPFQMEQETPQKKAVTIEDFIKLFSPGGRAIIKEGCEQITTKPSRTSLLKLSSFTESDAVNFQWPHSKDMRFHGIYYNRDKLSEKFDVRCSRLRERYLMDETETSCPKQQRLKQKEREAMKRKKSTQQATGRLVAIATEARRVSPRKKPSGALNQSISFLAHSTDKNRSANHSKKARHSISHFPADASNRLQRRVSITATHPINTDIPQHRSKVKKTHRESITRHTDTIKQNKSSDRLGDSDYDEPDGGELGTNKDQATEQSSESSAESRSQRHRRKLSEVVDSVLKAEGVNKSSPLYKACASKLFQVTKLFVMDLLTSRNLRVEMTKIAQGQVKQVVEMETRKQMSKKRKT